MNPEEVRKHARELILRRGAQVSKWYIADYLISHHVIYRKEPGFESIVDAIDLACDRATVTMTWPEEAAPLPDDIEGVTLVATKRLMTEAQWDHLMAVLVVMKPGLVARNANGAVDA